MILVIDNYDSFTHNLVHLLIRAGGEVEVVRNDRLTVAEAIDARAGGYVISPGPGGPGDAGISLDLVRSLPADVPLLGVCLGHQVIAEAFGGRVVRSAHPTHGKAAAIVHDGRGLFGEFPQGGRVARYHSLVVDGPTLPECLEVGAWLADDPTTIMAIRHKHRPIHGVQFHPESFLTSGGLEFAEAFVRVAGSPA